MKEPNLISFVYIFRNKLNALLGADPDFTILEVDEPLPDGTIERRKNQHTLNIICSDMVKLTVAKAHIGDTFEDGEVLNIDYYFGRPNSKGFLNIKDRPAANTNLDIELMFRGNPHFSKMYSGYGPFGPWFCVAFKPELIQYYTEDTSSLHGYKSCAMEDIARDVFNKEDDKSILFSTENIADYFQIPNAYCVMKEGKVL